jgi:CheY-like chemotaxis protein
MLIVEDDPLSRRTLVMLLATAGYHTEAVGSAEEALWLSQRRGVPLIALVDIDLPGMSGLDLIRRLKSLDSSVHPIVLSASNQEGLAELLKERGVPFLRKPIDFNRLLELVEESGGSSWQ